MNTLFRRSAGMALIIVMAASLGACNTLHGFGRDTERAGEKLQEEVDDNRPTPQQHVDDDDDDRARLAVAP